MQHLQGSANIRITINDKADGTDLLHFIDATLEDVRDFRITKRETEDARNTRYHGVDVGINLAQVNIADWPKAHRGPRILVETMVVSDRSRHAKGWGEKDLAS